MKRKIAGLALLIGSIIPTDAKAQQPLPKQFTVIEQRAVIVPYTTWQEQRTLVPQIILVPQTTWHEQKTLVPKTEYRQQIIEQPVTYRKVENDCCIARGIGEFVDRL